jgi:hypothetical protein
MSHWHDVMPGALLDVPYAELVRNPDAMAARVFEFCGLPIESGCTDIIANRSLVSTLSAVQIREPIHTRSLGVWRRYAGYLQPLQNALSGFAQP